MPSSFNSLAAVPPVNFDAGASYSLPAMSGPPPGLIFRAPQHRIPDELLNNPRRRAAEPAVKCFENKAGIRASGLVVEKKEVPCATTTTAPAVAQPVKMCQVQERYPPRWHGNVFSETIIVTQPCKEKKSWCW